MVKVKSSSDAKKKYVASTNYVTESYKDGVSDANWKDAASSDEAEELYQAALAESMAAKRRQKGIEDVSNEEWRERAKTKGAKNIASGMRAGAAKWQKNVEPYLDTLRSIELPPRTTSGVQNVQNRVIPIVEALEAKKKEIKG